MFTHYSVTFTFSLLGVRRTARARRIHMCPVDEGALPLELGLNAPLLSVVTVAKVANAELFGLRSLERDGSDHPTQDIGVDW